MAYSQTQPPASEFTSSFESAVRLANQREFDVKNTTEAAASLTHRLELEIEDRKKIEWTYLGASNIQNNLHVGGVGAIFQKGDAQITVILNSRSRVDSLFREQIAVSVYAEDLTKQKDMRSISVYSIYDVEKRLEYRKVMISYSANGTGVDCRGKVIIQQTIGGAEISLANTDGNKRLLPEDLEVIGSQEIISAVQDIMSGTDPVTYVTKMY